jgi:large conductance mechanosensitive channel
MPIVGLLTGGVDFTQKFIALDGGHYDTLMPLKK